MIKIISVLTSFNRKDKTINCLKMFELSCVAAGVLFEAVLVDDGSSDGTANAVESLYPWVTIIQTEGNLYWCRGMHIAMEHGLKKNGDFILWLNDDTDLFCNAIKDLIDAAFSNAIINVLPIIVGSTTSNGVNITYGGQVRKSNFKRFSYYKVWSDTHSVECDVMNGNVVLIPSSIVNLVGNLDTTYEHAMGDIDYSLRAKKLGVKIFVAAGRVGFCSHNSIENTYLDVKLTKSERWKHLLSKKGLPIKSWKHFTYKHGGWSWFIYFFFPYIKLGMNIFLLKR